MRTILSGIVIACLSLLGAQWGMGPGPGTPASSVGCSPPSMTYRWAGYAAGNLCAGPVSCTTNGQTLLSFADLVASNTATAATGTPPTYLTSAVNSLPGFVFNGASSGNQTMAMATAIPSSPTTYTLYAILDPTSFSHNSAIISGTSTSSLIWYFNTSGQQAFFGGTTITGTTTYSTGSYITIVLTYSGSSYAFYKCSGGSCTSDGTGTQAQTILSASGSIGDDSFNDFLNANVAEIGILIGTASNSGIGAWSQCKYGI